MANIFGGNWTEDKIQMVYEYAKAYLDIMKSRTYFHLIYFDGFAGSGNIFNDSKPDIKTIEGAASKILSISEPREFNWYYFVELDESNAKALNKFVAEAYPTKKYSVVSEDCNKKLKDLSTYLRNPKNKNVRVLAFIDPYGMELQWSALEHLKGLNIDIWILLPTGIGITRLLKNDGSISDAWFSKLESCLGLDKEAIKSYFYKQKENPTLFGVETTVVKEENVAAKAAELYRTQLGKLFEYVTTAYPLKNSTNSTMYHFLLASNNQTAYKISESMINKRLKK
ncbi:hypothetical protein BH09BAC1_BH09BAC1_15050 [soil metagenome]